MNWVKLDDKLWMHPKLDKVSAAGAALWLRAASWCGFHGTDGVVPENALRWFRGARRRDAENLVAAGLWEPVEGVGWRFHDWTIYNPTAQKIEDARAAEAERKRQEREAQKLAEKQAAATRRPLASRAPASLEPNGSHAPASENPGIEGEARDGPGGRPGDVQLSRSRSRSRTPGGEVPSPPAALIPKGESHLSEDWKPTEGHRVIAEELQVDLTLAATQFRNHARTENRTAKDWNLAFTAWLKRAPAVPRDPAWDIPGNEWMREQR